MRTCLALLRGLRSGRHSSCAHSSHFFQLSIPRYKYFIAKLPKSQQSANAACTISPGVETGKVVETRGGFTSVGAAGELGFGLVAPDLHGNRKVCEPTRISDSKFCTQTSLCLPQQPADPESRAVSMGCIYF